MEAGKLWYSRVDKNHWVKNDSDIDRIHLVIDIKPTEEMKEMLDIQEEYSINQVNYKKFKNFTSWKEFNYKSKVLYLSFANFNKEYKSYFAFYDVLKTKGYKKFFVRDLSCTWLF